MQIILNDLKEIAPHRPYEANQSSLISNLAWKLQETKNTRDMDYVPISAMSLDNVEEFHKGFLGMLSNAYSRHRKVTVNPHDLWFLVLCELAEVIKANAALCRSLFTKQAEGKVEISIPTGDPTTIDLAVVVDHLKALVPMNTDLFVPELSTLDDNARIAMYAALCDGLQHYYSYSTFCCGIQEIKLGGTAEDYNMLLTSVAELAQSFKNIGFGEVVEYLTRVGDVFVGILKAFIKGETDFFKNIFTQKNVGSGGELLINGWITDLYYTKRDMPKIQNFETSFAIVPYKNLDTGREFKSVHGAFKRMLVDGFLTCGYDSVIFEKGIVAPTNDDARIKIYIEKQIVSNRK